MFTVSAAALRTGVTNAVLNLLKNTLKASSESKTKERRLPATEVDESDEEAALGWHLRIGGSACVLMNLKLFRIGVGVI